MPFIDECTTEYLQNKEISESVIYENDAIYVGSHVTSTEPEGPVVIESGKTTLRANSATLNGVTEVKLGAELEITTP